MRAWGSRASPDPSARHLETAVRALVEALAVEGDEVVAERSRRGRTASASVQDDRVIAVVDGLGEVISADREPACLIASAAGLDPQSDGDWPASSRRVASTGARSLSPASGGARRRRAVVPSIDGARRRASHRAQSTPVISKRAPPAALSVTRTSQPWARAISRTMLSPNPVPPSTVE